MACGQPGNSPFRIEEGKAYGPGIFDMQSSLVLVEFALAALRQLGLALLPDHRPSHRRRRVGSQTCAA